ncbi:MAG: amino acid ABC transporter substrate-binding protein [Algicola sp.]|nr:amino acid ABC transporter substrate-binding protein [Algicola sp.]
MIKVLTLFWVILSLAIPMLANAQECLLLRAGGTISWQPIAYFNQETQKPEGIGYDLTKVVGQRLKIPVEINAKIPWKRLLKFVKDGDMDLISAIYRTPQRDKHYHFSIPYFVNEARVFVKKGAEFPFAKLSDLIARRGVIPLGGSFGEDFDSFVVKHPLTMETLATKQQLVTAILQGLSDYFIQDYRDGMTYLKQQGLENKIVALNHPVSVTPVHLAVSRQSSCAALLPEINQIIKLIKVDGTFEKIIDKYRNKDETAVKH